MSLTLFVLTFVLTFPTIYLSSFLPPFFLLYSFLVEVSLHILYLCNMGTFVCAHERGTHVVIYSYLVAQLVKNPPAM